MELNFFEIPPVTKSYFLASTCLMILCSLDLVSPFTLYLNWGLVLRHYQLWRLVTCFLFFGNFGLPFFWNAYVLVYYCGSLEETSFSGKAASFLWMIIVSCWMLLV
uniref:Derlin n=1 Tax=Chromera velia CCMP2878 TaxID=1169474 RepID=A0A0G4H9R6_9ALVE|eukprot:Cvel_25460.t1-p1 / transcript=Cvel_25460.t1 / gene=Cvel_25460 / organism=Chromera_velia_CCMP2878 / gene_product=Derlin-2.2, putative / transcript_product=Derlin-2.2, putative / location=Cvel_scaffold2887:20887-22682(+) / protein_length=105 / sequence_SO=supercontig / SO=protein_coding / is_pseudo=false